MSSRSKRETKVVPAVHGLREVNPDGEFEMGLAEFLKNRYSPEALVELYGRFSAGAGAFDAVMRRTIWRAVARRFGNGIQIGTGVAFTHLETFEIGDGAFIAPQTQIQGWYAGKCVIGKHVWIGPQSYFDARDLIIEDYVGWGPGAKVLCSIHSGAPVDIPIVQTSLNIRPVRIEAWADIGTGAVVMPGVTVGKGSIVGAGAIVTEDVQPYAVVAGVPARFIRWREGDRSDG